MNRPAPYMPQLDGLRAIAVSAVLVHHHHWANDVTGAAASAGVRLFFVLSGFLITGILLRARDASAGVQKEGLRRFYVRRCLRIFPLYYGVILVAVVLNLGPARDVLPWLLTYTLNFHFEAQGWFDDYFAHFWSLRVEEQFYVFWPWIVMFLPARFLIWATIGMISVSPLLRAQYLLLNNQALVSGLGIYVSTWICLDSLGVGALLAVANYDAGNRADVRKYLDRWMAPAALLTLAAATLWSNEGAYLVRDTCEAVIFAWLISRAGAGFSGIAGAFLQSRVLVYLGKISYGVYVLHPFAQKLLERFAPKVSGLRLSSWVEFTELVALSLLMASFSWYLMEKPLNDLKERFAGTGGAV